MKKIIVLGFIVCIAGIVHCQQLSDDEKEILLLQDQRVSQDGKLAGYVASKDPHLRCMALIAFANIQDTASAKDVIPLLSDTDARVRMTAAFALGQIGGPPAERSVYRALDGEKEDSVRAAMLKALGRCGGAASLDSLMSADTARHYNSKALAQCFTQFALRGIRSERSIWKCFELLAEKSPDVRWNALYALWRSAPYGLIDLEIDQNIDMLLNLAADEHPLVRMNLATLAGRSKAKSIEILLDSLESSERHGNDWRSIVQIIKSRTIQQFVNGKNLSRVIDYLHDTNEHCRITALECIEAIPFEVLHTSDFYIPIGKELQRMIGAEAKESDPVRGEALVVIGKHYPGFIDNYEFIIQDEHASNFLKRKYFEAVSQRFTKQHLDFLIRHTSDESILLSMAAWDFNKQFLMESSIKVMGLDSSDIANTISRVCSSAVKSLKRNDIGIATVVANVFSQPATSWLLHNAAQKQTVIDALLHAYTSCDSPDDIEAQIALVDALGQIGNESCVSVLEDAVNKTQSSVAEEAKASLLKITGKPYAGHPSPRELPEHGRKDWSELASLQSDQKIELKTSKGAFIMQLMKADAPFTVLSFVRLARKNYYDGLTFHRVVSNFVVQGGDPRGDGWGGPGYTLRTEVSPAEFDEGTCGMASAGKDTEGSQFFITHSPAPHLNGRYTVFARVIEGMDVVNRIQMDDRILSVRLLE